MARKRSEPKPLKVRCAYCKGLAVLTTGADLYRTTREPMASKWFWLCAPCEAYVGCHPRSRAHAPLGSLAKADLREARRACHRAFDALWRAKMRRDDCTQHVARTAAYRWMASKLRLEGSEAHIGMFDMGRCADLLLLLEEVAAGRHRILKQDAAEPLPMELAIDAAMACRVPPPDSDHRPGA